MIWGLLLSVRQHQPPRPAWMLDLHRFLGGGALGLLGLHLAALSFDSFVGFAWRELFVPYASRGGPARSRAGIVALYLVLAVELTSLMMRSLGRGLWHAIHLLSLAVFVSVTVHALLAGADAAGARGAGVRDRVSSSAVAGLCVLRVTARRAPRQPAPAAVTR